GRPVKYLRHARSSRLHSFATALLSTMTRSAPAIAPYHTGENASSNNPTRVTITSAARIPVPPFNFREMKSQEDQRLQSGDRLDREQPAELRLSRATLPRVAMTDVQLHELSRVADS